MPRVSYNKFLQPKFSQFSVASRVVMSVSEVEEHVVEVHHLPTVVEETSKRQFHFPKVNLQVSLSQAEIPRVEKCCICFDLRCGLNVWLIIEAIIWFFLFVCAFFYEFVYIENYELLDFFDKTQDWYSYLIFGERLFDQPVDQRIRSEFKFFI